MYNIIDSEYISITLDTVLILKNSKTTKTGIKTADFRNSIDTDDIKKKQI